ncbi:hypothetical protein ZIOFF_061584 [Zingiber officinale]|uniref:Uncharacterized protein n=1 Tax=Zingiber officinale TaxID=94328 RepID=A0A8J5KCR3_ZINOF|nr:hypothetical protein ZIOFF_061584 [Zingiber officinale]
MVEESGTEKAAGASAGGDFVIRHWRSNSSPARDHSRLPLQAPARPDPFDVGLPSPNGALGADSDRPLQAGGGAGYTSLRDLICLQRGSPEAVLSTYAPGGGGGGEIRIRNRLVKQAAHAYLQPTPSGAEYCFRRRRNGSLRRALAILTCGLAVEPLDACIAFLRHLFRRTRQ